MKLTYEGENSEVVIGRPRTINGAFKQMSKHLKGIGFKSYYNRINLLLEENRLWIDFGSHYNFFNLYDLTEENWNELFQGTKTIKERGK